MELPGYCIGFKKIDAINLHFGYHGICIADVGLRKYKAQYQSILWLLKLNLPKDEPQVALQIGGANWEGSDGLLLLWNLVRVTIGVFDLTTAYP